ncbi:hypothetical protein [Lentibacillus cibarius]|uniref:Uncharacterized protein n=1 Tax=Lentibacillus cibarius TaxID=2583219 RepID=A0A5S3QFI3_9BACI|nr:hypothetical protein [Lentibacillus cibarius]TMN18716.1 hypothetical protein FFL34_18020 [Lentibacillus cibarius]
MKNLRNLQDKHVVAFIQARQEAGVATKTIRNDLGRYATCMIWFLMPNMNWLPIMSWKSSMGLNSIRKQKGIVPGQMKNITICMLLRINKAGEMGLNNGQLVMGGIQWF